MNQKEELLHRLSNININRAVKEYLYQHLGHEITYNIEAFSVDNIYDSNKLWNNRIVKKPTLLDLEKYYKLSLERELKEDADICWKNLRQERNKLLADTDWTQLPDVPIETKERMIYRNYRKYLRDKPKDYKDETVKSWKIASYDEYKKIKYPK